MHELFSELNTPLKKSIFRVSSITGTQSCELLGFAFPKIPIFLFNELYVCAKIFKSADFPLSQYSRKSLRVLSETEHDIVKNLLNSSRSA